MLIQGYCQGYIFSEGFGNIINLENMDLYILPSDKVKSLPDNSIDLLYSVYYPVEYPNYSNIPRNDSRDCSLFPKREHSKPSIRLS